MKKAQQEYHRRRDFLCNYLNENLEMLLISKFPMEGWLSGQNFINPFHYHR